jgi:hypothetical protein
MDLLVTNRMHISRQRARASYVSGDLLLSAPHHLEVWSCSNTGCKVLARYRATPQPANEILVKVNSVPRHRGCNNALNATAVEELSMAVQILRGLYRPISIPSTYHA